MIRIQTRRRRDPLTYEQFIREVREGRIMADTPSPERCADPGGLEAGRAASVLPLVGAGRLPHRRKPRGPRTHGPSEEMRVTRWRLRRSRKTSRPGFRVPGCVRDQCPGVEHPSPAPGA